MLTGKTIAVSLAAMLVSASAATAATTHRQHGAVVHHQTARDARASANAIDRANARSQGQVGPYYYEPSDNGSAWSYYPGYTDH